MASLFELILLHEPADHGPNGIFFCVNGEIEACEITAALAEAFYEAGITKEAEAVPLPEDQYEKAPVSLSTLI